MIPLQRFRKPPNFNKRIRDKGYQWLQRKGIDLHAIVPEGFVFKYYWVFCKSYLERKYNHYCAYTCFYMHPTERTSIDHIKPKSRVEAYLAYEWKNYCLCCERINTKKGDKLNIINPFEVTENLFCLVLGTGYIYVNPSYSNSSLVALAKTTIEELDLNNGFWKKARREVYKEFGEAKRAGASLEYAEERLKKENIFVWSEAKRQGKLI